MPEIKGKDNIISFFKTFFGRNEETKHLWTTVISENKLKQVNWGVVCKKKWRTVYSHRNRLFQNRK